MKNEEPLVAYRVRTSSRWSALPQSTKFAIFVFGLYAAIWVMGDTSTENPYDLWHAFVWIFGILAAWRAFVMWAIYRP